MPKELKITKDHSTPNFIEDISKGVTTRRFVRKVCNHIEFVSQIEPK